MASSTTTLPAPLSASATIVSRAARRRRSARRRIDPKSGHALEKLGHAIEYLADEYVRAGGSLCAHNGQLEAVQLLMAANRAIYFACPQVESPVERLRRWLRLAPQRA
ncbi:MAG TPA: hypothetical protein VMD55_04390 [Terracidiphilus sp.]|jgi:hypothetical protein|nr:hypothetical protein [Terracidiphilus sp.]